MTKPPQRHADDGLVLPRRAQPRRKGKKGELELAEFLRSHGFKARRGQQFKGGRDNPDILVPSLPGFHWECKRVEAFRLYDSLAQAVHDAGDRTPIVAHRQNKQQWVAVLRLEDLLSLLALYIEEPPCSSD